MVRYNRVENLWPLLRRRQEQPLSHWGVLTLQEKVGFSVHNWSVSCGNFICFLSGLDSCLFACVVERLSGILVVGRDASADGTLLAVKALAADVHRGLILSWATEHGSIGLVWLLILCGWLLCAQRG